MGEQEMKITKFRIRKAIECYKNGRQQGRNIFVAIRLALWWFEPKFNFVEDKKGVNKFAS